MTQLRYKCQRKAKISCTTQAEVVLQMQVYDLLFFPVPQWAQALIYSFNKCLCWTFDIRFGEYKDK